MVLIVIAGFVIFISHKRMFPAGIGEGAIDLVCGSIGAFVGYWLS
jgi:hypothetical protein